MGTTFENNLDQLEKIVESLEEGSATLNECLKAFEKGIKLSRDCHSELDKAEKKVEILIKENGEIKGREAFDE